jgi:Protein of unknown function (DUF2931)
MVKVLKLMGWYSLLLSFAGCATARDKFEWQTTESAPKHYPMKIIRGTLIYHGEAEAGLYIPSGGTLSSGWGDPISSHTVGEKF